MEIKFKKGYLTIEEIAEIVEEVKGYKESYNREVNKINLVVKTLVDYNFGEMLNTEVYNFAVENAVIELIEDNISNYYIIDKMIKEELSVENTVREFLEELDSKIDKLSKKMPKSFDVDGVIESIQKVLNKNANV